MFDCEQHKRCRCEEPSQCECLDKRGCREYASPSLTWSKVGVVLHLQWREEDGTLFTIDCDLNCPTWPTHTRFDGNTNDAENYLMRKRPVGWLEELSKLENMTAAAASAHLLISKSWPVKFRLINKDRVLPGQTLLFMNDQVLEGNKLQAYVIIKILKYCTGSSARSYQCKFAVQQVFKNKRIESMEEVGAAIKEIIHYNTIRGKFSSVHPDLAAEGVTKVEVGEEGVHQKKEYVEVNEVVVDEVKAVVVVVKVVEMVTDVVRAVEQEVHVEQSGKMEGCQIHTPTRTHPIVAHFLAS